MPFEIIFNPDSERGITGLSVRGFKSIAEQVSIRIAHLTILAGANCSGKSSIMQPLLLLHQTLLAPFDPVGALLLDGPSVSFRLASQVLSRVAGKRPRGFSVGVATNGGGITNHFVADRGKGFRLDEMALTDRDGTSVCLREGMGKQELLAADPDLAASMQKEGLEGMILRSSQWEVRRARCYLQPSLVLGGGLKIEVMNVPSIVDIRHVIHIPALRGSRRGRAYPATADEDTVRGAFEDSIAGFVLGWQRADDARLQSVNRDLLKLGLTPLVKAKPISDTEVELLVERRAKPSRGKPDLISITDTGYGVSQVLPVLVALHRASPEDLVFIEEPEIHLHPRAQVALAGILCDAAKRGVRAVVETHSALLLLAIQTLVAERTLPPSDVCLHWFHRDESGITQISSAQPDETGQYSDWPEDFGSVELAAQRRYLDAGENE